MDSIQIPPAKSPLLQPHQVRTSSADSYGLSLVQDPTDDLEFLGPAGWEHAKNDQEDDLDSEDDVGLEGFSLEEGHIVGVPSSAERMDAR